MALVEVKVPDIGDFKDVEIIELLVKPGEYPFVSFGCFAGAALLRSSWPFGGGELMSRTGQNLARAREYWTNLVARWERECTPAAFQQLVRELDGVRAALMDLPRRRQERLAELEAHLEAQQRESYLDRFKISRSLFRTLRPDEIAMLASYGIETAGDVLSAGNEIGGMVSMTGARELQDWAHMQVACDTLGRHKRPILWGPLRHGIGHNIAIYHRDPDEHMVEFYTELDQMKSEALGYFDPRPWHEDRPQRPKVWDRDDGAMIWGVPPTPEFLRGRPPLPPRRT